MFLQFFVFEFFQVCKYRVLCRKKQRYNYCGYIELFRGHDISVHLLLFFFFWFYFCFFSVYDISFFLLLFFFSGYVSIIIVIMITVFYKENFKGLNGK